MKKISTLFGLLAATVLSVQAQTQKGCATPPIKSAWLEAYQRGMIQVHDRNNEMLYVPMVLNVIGNDAGQGYFPRSAIYRAICSLNQDFAPANIYFYVRDDFRYYNNSEWYTHDYATASGMFDATAVNDAISTYIVEDPAGACGYSWQNAVVLGKNCIGDGDKTWAHENGHDLSLPHTFYGWEGTNYNPNEPTPSAINGEQVERLDGSNCYSAADGFCDTPPDYLSYRWTCNNEGVSIEHFDPTGDSFRADGSYYMSYSDDNCATRFSAEEIAAMRANLLSEKPHYLNQEAPLGSISEVDTLPLISPAPAEEVPYNFVQLRWHTVPNAAEYHLQVSRTSGFEIIIKDRVVTDTVFNVQDALLADKTYFWRVKPINRFDYCAPYSKRSSFKTTQQVAATAPTAAQWQVRPTLLSAGTPLTIYVPTAGSETAAISVVTSTGQAVYQMPMQTIVANEFSLATQHWAKGMYVVHISTPHSQYIQKIVIQ